MRLWDKLVRILPDILPDQPEEALTGTDIISRLKEKYWSEIGKDYTENTLRAHFSVMSQDPLTPIAKKDSGYGYYRRPAVLSQAEDVSTSDRVGDQTPPEPEKSRDRQREEKFRSLYMRYRELKNEFPILVEHTRAARQEAGINKWKFSDVITASWSGVSGVNDNGWYIDQDILEVKRNLGEQPVELTSTELKVSLNASSLREYFFQCVSNSKWAHHAQLVIATKVSDSNVAEELRRLGISYDVSVVSYGLDLEWLDQLPNADAINKMTSDEIEVRTTSIIETKLASAHGRENLDWEHIRDLRVQSPDFRDLFSWLAECLETKKVRKVSSWRKIRELEEEN